MFQRSVDLHMCNERYWDIDEEVLIGGHCIVSMVGNNGCRNLDLIVFRIQGLSVKKVWNLSMKEFDTCKLCTTLT